MVDSDSALVQASLKALQRAGARLADGIECDDIDDAALELIDAFRANPITTLATLRDPDEAPMLVSASGEPLTGLVVMFDPGSTSSGSMRLALNEWDVRDTDFDL